jgi:branched-chain amino acid transport system substrate-binding protein
MKGLFAAFMTLSAFLFVPQFAQGETATVKFTGIVELSGPGATSGTNFDQGVRLAVDEINAAGGILGRKIDYTSSDTQTSPQIAKELAQQAVDEGSYVVFGPVFTGSIMVSMAETRRAEVPNFTGGEGTSITQQGNPYIFRTSFSQAAVMPRVARYMKDTMKLKSVALMWVNNDFGKGGHDAIKKECETRGIKIAADISTDQGQVDFSGPVLLAKQANADAAFVYLNEDESARALREFRKQGYDKPLVGETTLVGEKVIELAGDAANGAIGHVSLTADAPLPGFKAFKERFQKRWGHIPDHNGVKGYTGVYVVKAITEKVGKFDRKAFAAALHGATILAKDNPGVLMDVSYDQNGDLDRQSFMVRVENGEQHVFAVLPPLSEQVSAR